MRRHGGRAELLVVELALCVAGGCVQAPAGGDAPRGSARFALAGSWSAVDPMAGARGSHTATLLPSGRVLVAGGEVYRAGISTPVSLDTAELFDPLSGTWASTGTMNESRTRHIATLLDDGRVLVAGGIRYADTSRCSAELYDEATGRWTMTGPLTFCACSPVAVRLPSGEVLALGGSSAAVYSPATGTWRVVSSMTEDRRSGYAAVLLPSGRVLVVGGWYLVYPEWRLHRSTEEYDPATDTWSAVGDLWTGRAVPRAILLASGQVLVAGGCSRAGLGEGCSGLTGWAELYDPATGAWTPTGAMASPRAWFQASLLPDGKVLAAGGCSSPPGPGGDCVPARTAELYDPAAGTWSETGSMADERSSHALTLLGSGGVLASGGSVPDSYLDGAEVYDSGTGGRCRVCGGDGTCVEMSPGAVCGTCSICDDAGACVPAPPGTLCGLCAACDDAGGCTVAAVDDPACGVLDCDGFDTPCRDYRDIEADRCQDFGRCRPPDDEATCTDYVDAGRGARCRADFRDGFEASSSEWSLSPRWARTTRRAHDGSWSLTPSLAEGYCGAGEVTATIDHPLSFVGARESVLTFWHWHSLGSWANAYVMAEVEGGGLHVLREYSGSQRIWEFVEIPLDAYFIGRSEVRIRFEFQGDIYDDHDEGWYVDDVAITGVFSPCEECDAGGVCGPAPDGTSCEDSEPCDGSEVCTAGSCAETAPPSCDDGNPCTADWCIPATGCTNAPVDGAPCGGGDRCTVAGRCSGGACVGGGPLSCDDENPCTADSCDPATGCTNAPVDGIPCAVEDRCSVAGRCSGGACVGGGPLSCDDENPCTADSCDPGTGCTHAPASGAPCDDGNESTFDDACTADGVCVGTVPAATGGGYGCRAAAPGRAAVLPEVLGVLATLLVACRRRTS